MLYILEEINGWEQVVESAVGMTSGLTLAMCEGLRPPEGLPGSVKVEIIRSPMDLAERNWSGEDGLYIVTNLDTANSPEVRPFIDAVLDHVPVYWGKPDTLKDKTFSSETFRFSPAKEMTGWHPFSKGGGSAPKKSPLTLWLDRASVFLRMLKMRYEFKYMK